MTTKIKTEREVEIATIRISVAVRYDAEDIPYDFPLRKGDMWEAEVDVDTGKIQDWPSGTTGKMHMKVCDCGTYTLLAKDGSVIAVKENDYVPHGIVPGECGDYIVLQIDASGVIDNWPKHPDVSQFFSDDEE